jgi:hypothetical protein
MGHGSVIAGQVISGRKLRHIQEKKEMEVVA